MSNYYANNEMQSLDCEFNAQLQRAISTMGLLPAVVNQLQNDWEMYKISILNNIRSRYAQVGGYNHNIIQSVIDAFLQRGLSVYTRAQVTGNNSYMPMNNIQQTPYMQQQYPPNYYAPPAVQPPMHGLQAFGNQTNTLISPTNQSTPVNQYQYAQISTNPQLNDSTVVNSTPQPEAPAVAPLVIKETSTTFTSPTYDEADETYGNTEHTTGLGTFKVMNMVSGTGDKYKHVVIKLYDPCSSDEEAVMRAKRIYTGSGTVHMNIEYDKTVCIDDIPAKTLTKILAEIRKSIPLSSRAKNKLKYLQQINKAINSSCKDYATIASIEQFIMQQFHETAGIALINSENNTEFRQQGLAALIALSDKDTKDPDVQEWQKIPGFYDRFIEVCDKTIKQPIQNMTVLDPNDPKELTEILKMHVGLTESDEGDLVDITFELIGKIKEYAEASATDKLHLYGTAGKIVANSSVVVLKHQHVVYTNLQPGGTVGIKDDAMVIHCANLCIGGITDGEPNQPDSTFEYMVTQTNNANGTGFGLILDYGCCSVKYHCVLALDNWYVLKTKKVF